MDSGEYFRKIHEIEIRARVHNSPNFLEFPRFRSVNFPQIRSTNGPDFLGFSISNETMNSQNRHVFLPIPQGVSCSSRVFLDLAQSLIQAQFFRHLPQEFVRETRLSQGTKHQGG